MERSILVRVQTMVSQLAMCHTTNGMDEGMVVKIFKPVLVQVMGVRTTVEVMSRRILDSVLIVSIL